MGVVIYHNAVEGNPVPLSWSKFHSHIDKIIAKSTPVTRFKQFKLVNKFKLNFIMTDMKYHQEGFDQDI